jgi:hypothetical protein
VKKLPLPISDLSPMKYGSMSNDNGLFNISTDIYKKYAINGGDNLRIIKRAVGGAEFIRGIVRWSIYVDDDSTLSEIQENEFSHIFQAVHEYRASSKRAATRKLADIPMLFAERRHEKKIKIFVPQVLSERREYVTAGMLAKDDLVIAPHMQIVDGGLHEFAILSSRMHHVWIATVCGRLKSDLRYSNLLGWNTFPLPALTKKNKIDLAQYGADILIARESHYPLSIAELYDPDKMPGNLRDAHNHNDEILERAYVGRCCKNDTERLEILLKQYERLINGGELNDVTCAKK